MKKVPLLIGALFSMTQTAFADPLGIVTDIPPVHSLVSQVLGDRGMPPELLLSGQDDPHGFQLRPSQARTLSEADLIIWMGEDLTPWLSAAIETIAPDSHHLELLAVAGTNRGDSDHDDRKEGREEDRNRAHERHGADPHAWLDPDNAATWLEHIAEQLAQLDPAHAGIYRANARSARADTETLIRRIKAELSGIEGIPGIALHDAYGHFEARFGLHFLGYLRKTDAAAPGAARIAALQNLFRSGRIRCVFREPGHDPKLLLSLTKGADIRVEQLDPLGVELEPGPELYGELLGKMAAAIRSCTDE